MKTVDSLAILKHFYPEDTPLRRLLISHSEQVRDKALAILEKSGKKLDRQLVADGAMLHDIGIGHCHAPSILCEGTEPYIAHGTIGGRMLREYGAECGLDMEPYARICERHTGSGLTAEEIRRQKLPIPERKPRRSHQYQHPAVPPDSVHPRMQSAEPAHRTTPPHPGVSVNSNCCRNRSQESADNVPQVP